MLKSIISLILLCSWAAVSSAATTADLAPGAPDRHVVVRGDTLWGIAARFLTDPWRWPDIWRMNREQIRNPHRIYPGDIIALDRTATDVRLRLLRSGTVKLSPQVRITPLEGEAIPMIPLADIQPFLSKPLIVGQNELDNAPRIVRTQESRVALGAGNFAFVQGIEKGQGEFWQLFRKGSALVDPDTKEILGYEAIYLGEARVTRYGPVSTIEITESPLEISTGDYLVKAPNVVTFNNYVPRAPQRPIDSRIIAAYGGLFEVGNYSIVVVNRGARDGLEVGHVLAIHRDLNASVNQLREAPLYGRTGFIYDPKNLRTNYREEPLRTRDAPMYGRVGPFGARFKDEAKRENVTLPDERYGLMMVFRVFDRASYALIMNADRQVNVLDIAKNPGATR